MSKPNTQRGLVLKWIGVSFTLLLLVVLVSALPSYAGQDYPLASSSGQHPFNRGNTVGNTANGGLAVYYDGWIYYVNINSDWLIYRVCPAGEAQFQLPYAAVGGLNAYDGWIYFVANFSGQTLHRMRPDGSGLEQLTDSPVCDCFSVVDGWIYYVNHDDGKIYRMQADGNNKEMLSDDSWCHKLNVVGGTVYYLKGDGGHSGGKIYRMNIDGSSRGKLYDGYAISLNVVDGWIYYVEHGGGHAPHSIYKMRPDGGQRTKIAHSNTVWEINIDGDWIYLAGDEENFLYKMRTSGTDLAQLNDHFTVQITLVGDWIFYICQPVIDGVMRSGHPHMLHVDSGTSNKLSEVPILPISELDDYVEKPGNGQQEDTPGLIPGWFATADRNIIYLTFLAGVLAIPMLFVFMGIIKGLFRTIANFLKSL